MGEPAVHKTPGYVARLLENSTGGVRFIQSRQRNGTSGEDGGGDAALTPLLMGDEVTALKDFVQNDANDMIFEEYESPVPSRAPFDWKRGRPSLWTSAARSSWLVLQLISLGGLVLGAYGVLGFYLDINTADYCHWVPIQTLDRLRSRIRVAGVAFQVFWIECWQFLVLLMIFKWPLLKELNLLTITLLGAFGDVFYRLLLCIFDAYKSPWVPYPLNVLFCALVVYNSYAVAKQVCPDPSRRSDTLQLTFKLCCQFLLGVPTGLFLNYFLFSWFSQTPPGLNRALLAAVVPLIAIPCEAASRLCAIHLQGVNHPGTSYAVVAVVRGVCTIVFRILQANIESFELFIGLSIARGAAYIVERVTAPLRDYCLNKMLFYFLRCCCGCCLGRRQTSPIRSPRSQRLVADMSIQDIIFETMSVVYSIVVVYVYSLVYGVGHDKGASFRVEITRRIPVALAVEFAVNSLAVLFQTRFMNIPVTRVWRRAWKTHLAIALITTTMSVLYFTQYQLQLIRAVIQANGSLPLVQNCTQPFGMH